MSATDDVLAEVKAERVRQDGLWGEQNHPNGTGPLTDPLLMLGGYVQAADVATAARTRCEDRFARGIGSYLDILLEEVFEAAAEDDPAKLRTELVQVAAVAVAWAEKIDRDQARP